MQSNEVLTFPAGKTLGIVEKYSIHACPNSKGFNHKDVNYLALRKSDGGAMNRIYLIEEIIVFNPIMNSWSKNYMSKHYCQRLLSYVQDRERVLPFGSEDYKFYILSVSEDLPHSPRPQINNTAKMYFTRQELLDGKEILSPRPVAHSPE
ncbi:MAG: hypothetical protein LH606_02680, partial [Cytophagaceae bacterium]|nr:hypothetical protein [Cytophagaceae bacterium]